MTRRFHHAIAALCFAGGLAATQAQTYIWTGVGNGWKDQVVPLNNGAADLVFGDSVRQTIPFSGSFSANTLTFAEDDGFRFVSGGSPLTFSLGGGITTTTTFGSRVDFAEDITFNLSANQTWTLAQGGAVTLHGKLTGSGNLTISGTNQSFLLANLSGNATDYSGNLTLATDPSSPIGSAPTLVVWGNSSLGTGSITFNNGGTLVAHDAPVITNSLTLNAGPLLPAQVTYSPFRVRSWDTATTLAGAVTLANNTTLFSNVGYLNKVPGQFPNNTGIRPLPGPLTRYPVLITGAIGESGGARSLNITGPGIVILAGANTYTGGTNVGFATGAGVNGNGSLIFANQAAIPATGLLQSGLLNTAGAAGYLGIATSAVATPGSFQTFLGLINPGSSGAVGLDSLTANLPAAAPATFSEAINLTGFTTTNGAGVKLGTATSVILTGAITPQLTTNYNFGNGGGKLYVQSALINHTTATAVLANNAGVALMLYLQGANTYTGGTVANNGFIIFDGASALPASGTLRAGGSATNVGVSYLGFTNTTLGGNNVSGGSLTSGLFTKFDQANTWGVLGFDATNVGLPTTVSNLDLTGFNDGVFVGTTSAATLTGTITPTTVTNGNNAPNTYRFTAGDGGRLTVSGQLTSGSVVIGTPGGFQKMSDGTVVLSGNNSYAGGTTLNGFGYVTLAAGHNNAFGTGAITISPLAGGIVGLATEATGLNLANAIIFAQAAPAAGFTPQLSLTGANDFTLSGNISGPPLSNNPDDLNPDGTGTGTVTLVNATPINVTLTGDNSGYSGLWNVGNGTLTFSGANAAGHGTLDLDSDSATAAFTTSATLYGINGTNGGHVHLTNGINLTIDSSNPDGDYEFNGSLSAPGNLTTSAALTITSAPNGEIVYLAGHNQYSGGTTITGSGRLGLGVADSAGSGTVTVNAPDGGLILNSGVVFTNALVLTQGGLGGLGNFSPVSFNGVGGAPLTFGANQTVFPGIQADRYFPGQLTIDTDVVFANGGTFRWGLQDTTSPEGYGHLVVLGNLDLSSLSAASFNLMLQTVDANGDTGLASSITLGNNYQFVLVETGVGTITGFNANQFTIDATNFQGGLITAPNFYVTADSQHLYLNFAAVPEPSICALLALGAGWVVIRSRRRRA